VEDLTEDERGVDGRTLPRLLTHAPMGSRRPDLGLCDSLAWKREREVEQGGMRSLPLWTKSGSYPSETVSGGSRRARGQAERLTKVNRSIAEGRAALRSAGELG
jgi:hypothetical protein